MPAIAAAERALLSGDCAGSRSLYMSSTVAGSMTVPGSPRRRRPPSAGGATLASLPDCWARPPAIELLRRLAGDREADGRALRARSTRERREPDRVKPARPGLADDPAAVVCALAAAEASPCPAAAVVGAG